MRMVSKISTFVHHLTYVNSFTRAFFLVHVFSLFAFPCLAENLEPRRWTHIPIDSNFFGAGYAYTEADIGFDPVLHLENVEMDMDTWFAKYIRSFALFDKSARVSFMQTYQEGTWSGLLEGTPKKINRKGLSDAILRFAINLYGAPPLQGKEYIAYRSSTDVETIVGAGLAVQLPTGDYMDDKLINLGTNRFTFRPQFGVVHTRGKWSAEATGIVELYTDNNDFFNGKRLEQKPLYMIHNHLIYTFSPGIWAGASVGYDYGGISTVDGTNKDDRKQNLLWALSVGFPVNRHVSFKLAYIGTKTREDTGLDTETLTLGVSGYW